MTISDVTVVVVVVPVHNEAELLDRCLTALGDAVATASGAASAASCGSSSTTAPTARR